MNTSTASVVGASALARPTVRSPLESDYTSHFLSRCTSFLAFLVLLIGVSQSALAVAQTPPLGQFGPSLPFVPGLAGSSGVMLNDGTALLSGSSTLAYRFNPADATFTPTQPMAVMHTSTQPALLPDGRVLVPLGASNPTETRSEIYNPVTNSWSTTGPQTVPRQWPAVLTDVSGRVFVLGGENASSQPLASVLRYEPSTGQFVPAGNLSRPRTQVAAVRLANGKFLLAGGLTTNRILDRTAEIFDPLTGTSTMTGNLFFATYAANMVLLHDGRALMTGGVFAYSPDSIRVSPYANLFDPATGHFTRLYMTSDRLAHSATVLPSGEVLLMGGFDDFGQCLANTSIYYPKETNSIFVFREGPDMPRYRCAHTALSLGDGSILIVGGRGDRYGTETSEVADRFVLDAISKSGFEFP